MKDYAIALLAFIFMCASGTAGGADEEHLPDSVKIKTPTQTFNRYDYFAVKDGRVLFKPNVETTGKSGDWKPFRRSGLPENKKIEQFPVPSSIVEIHADADEIVALSDTRRFYWLRIKDGMSWDGNVWNHLWGWPEMEPLFLGGRAASPRAWAIGRRNRDVLYHEDIDGNPHHFGTMGITTLYVLTADGREICFTDSGLPADFSHTIALPNRGRFVAESMSVSASTIFVIDASGRMYTRLVDFDTIGSDPMFFKYSYRREKRGGSGEDWSSNFTEWSLPAEDWYEQPGIELNGQAELSSMITILQNGQGNSARELRVAGKNAEGKTGYFHKMIFDERWDFTESPVALEESRMLINIVPQCRELANGDTHYFGRIRIDGRYVPNTSVELVDFNLSESPSTLRITEEGEVSEMKLHSVEAWTYLKRNDPGRDGTPKVFLGTLEVPDGVKDSGTVKVLKEHNLKTFRFIVEATKEHVYIRPRSRLYGDLELILAAEGAPVKNSMAVRTYSLAQNGFDRMANADELKIGSYDTLTRADIPALKKKIDMNRKAMKQINAVLSQIERSSKRIRRSSIRYTAFNAIVHATGLFLIDKPKIWTVTRHFGTVLKGQKDSAEFLYFTGKRTHEEAIRRIKNRIDAYTEKINELEGRSLGGVFFSEHFDDYFRRLGIYDSELDSLLVSPFPEGIRATCDTTPVKEGKSFFFIHLGYKDEARLLTLLVKLPGLENEINRQMVGEDIVIGDYEAMIYLFENNGSKEAEVLYESAFLRRLPVQKSADEIKALLRVDKDGWEIHDTSGFEKNQLWLKHEGRGVAPPGLPQVPRTGVVMPTADPS